MVAIKGITAMIPVLGGTLTSVWSDIDAIQAKRKHERLEEFYLSLEMEVQKIKEQINESYINQPDQDRSGCEQVSETVACPGAGENA